MIIKTYIEPPIDNNNYLIIDEASKEAALIDCSSLDVNDKVKADLDKYEAKLKYILLTHGHFDHIAGFRQNTNTEYELVMHNADTYWLKQVNQFMPMFGMPKMTVPIINKFIDEGDILKLGEQKIKVLHTPGHTPGGVCYYVENILFTGDTIFREAVGRCDLEGGDFEQIVNSIKTKIYTLPDDTIIYPGHGKSSTIGWEKLHNRFL